jgi:hypothetical protein
VIFSAAALAGLCLVLLLLWKSLLLLVQMTGSRSGSCGMSATGCAGKWSGCGSAAAALHDMDRTRLAEIVRAPAHPVPVQVDLTGLAPRPGTDPELFPEMERYDGARGVVPIPAIPAEPEEAP